MSAISGDPARARAPAPIPTLLAAPGAAFATSNKPDLYAATALARAQRGRVWNFGPEALAGGEPDWWWNPLSYVTSDRRAGTDRRVRRRLPRSRREARSVLNPAGQELVSHLLRAAAIAQRPVTQAFLWSTRPNDDEPARILARPGLELAAASVLDHIHSPLTSAAACSEQPDRSCRSCATRHRPMGHRAPQQRTPPARPGRARAEQRHAVSAQQRRPGIERRAGHGARDGAMRRGRAARQALPRRAPPGSPRGRPG